MRRFICSMFILGLAAGFAAVAPAKADCPEECAKVFKARMEECEKTRAERIQTCHDQFPNDPDKLEACIKKANKAGKKCQKKAKKAYQQCLDECP